MGAGFAELCSRLPGHRLPGRSGLGATLMVHLDYATLADGVKAAALSTGTRLSAAQARLMACNLGIVPQVFGGKSVPLDHGREQRLLTKAWKQALAAGDGGCTGATTKLDDDVPICPHHHRLIHKEPWSLRLGTTGHIEYRAPGNTMWQRNHRWRP